MTPGCVLLGALWGGASLGLLLAVVSRRYRLIDRRKLAALDQAAAELQRAVQENSDGKPNDCGCSRHGGAGHDGGDWSGSSDPWL